MPHEPTELFTYGYFSDLPPDERAQSVREDTQTMTDNQTLLRTYGAPLALFILFTAILFTVATVGGA
ncbi:hypothetical protein ACFSM5_05180 [Lacibacterium aquatile]|uniref:Uncharacterized protein n=1 Tax=Lacibacterium aquatile TaxID=1168082 RepID=A0ABW5DP32_9PROT